MRRVLTFLRLLWRRVRRTPEALGEGDYSLREVAVSIGLDPDADAIAISIRLDELRRAADMTPEEREQRKVETDFRKHGRKVLSIIEGEQLHHQRKADLIVSAYHQAVATKKAGPQPDSDDSAGV